MTETDLRRLPSGAVWGVVLGCGSWSILLVAAFFGMGAPGLALRVGLPCVLLCAALIGAMLVGLDQSVRAKGFGSSEYKRLLFGILTLYLGILMILVNTWIGPALREAGVIEGETHSVLGVTSFPEWIPITCLAISACLLVPLAWRAVRAT